MPIFPFSAVLAGLLPTDVRRPVCAVLLLLACTALPAQMLYMRDFEGAKCNATYSYNCTGDDTGVVPSCTVCSPGPCHLSLSNDIWIDFDDGSASTPPVPANPISAQSSVTCPEVEDEVDISVHPSVLIAVRMLTGNGLAPASGSKAYTYKLRVYYVKTALSTTLNHFYDPVSTANPKGIHGDEAGILNGEVDIQFTISAAGAISGLATKIAGNNIHKNALASNKGFVVYIPWKIPPTIGGGTYATAHYCLLAELEEQGAGATDLLDRTFGAGKCIGTDPLTNASGAYEYAHCNNNVIWRNIDIININNPAPAPRPTEMMLQNFGEEAIQTWVEIEYGNNPPDGQPLDKFWRSTLDLSAFLDKMPLDPGLLMKANPMLREAGWEGDFKQLPLTGDRLILPDMTLQPGNSFPIRLTFDPLDKNPKEVTRHFVHFIQYQGKEGSGRPIGGNTILLKNNPVKPGSSGPAEDDCQGFWCWFKKWPWLWAIVVLILAGLARLVKRKPPKT